MEISSLLVAGVLLAILEPGLARSKYRTSSQDGVKEKEIWLDDFIKDYDKGEMQADMPIGDDGQILSYPTDPKVCPPPPRFKRTANCLVAKCESDQECDGYSQKCCYNGCVYTCLTSISSPPLEPCSTSAIVDDEDALLCPHDYMCHIEYLGEPEKGLPNRGRCIKENNDGVPHRKFRLKTEYRGKNVCVFENAVFADRASFVFQDHPCECHDSIITCNVSKQTKKKKRQKKKRVKPASRS